MKYEDIYCNDVFAQIRDYERIETIEADSDIAKTLKAEAMYKTAAFIVKGLYEESKDYYDDVARIEEGLKFAPGTNRNIMISEEYSREFLSGLSIQRLEKLYHRNMYGVPFDGMEEVRVKNMIRIASALGYEYERWAEQYTEICRDLCSKLHPEDAE